MVQVAPAQLAARAVRVRAQAVALMCHVCSCLLTNVNTRLHRLTRLLLHPCRRHRSTGSSGRHRCPFRDAESLIPCQAPRISHVPGHTYYHLRVGSVVVLLCMTSHAAVMLQVALDPQACRVPQVLHKRLLLS